MASDQDRRPGRPAPAPGALVPGLAIDLIEAYAQALLAMSGQVSLPLLDGEERRALAPGVEPTSDANDCAGALLFAPQVVERTGITAEHIEESLALRETLVLLRDLALRLALSAGDCLAAVEEGETGGCAVFERFLRGEAVEAVPLSQAIAAERETLAATASSR